MYEQRASRDVREGSYGHGDGSTSPWFDRSPGRPPYGRYRSVDALYWSSDGQYRSPVGQRRSMVSHLDSPYQSTDGPSAGLLDSLFAGQVRATTGPHRSNDRSPPEREVSTPVNRPGSRAADGPSRSLDGPRRSPDGPLRSTDGPPPEIAYLIDLGMPDASKVNNGRILKGRRSEFTPFKKDEDGDGQPKGLAQHKVRGSPIPADETSDEDADEPPPTGQRRSMEKAHRASKRRHHKLDGETNGVSDGLKTKVKDKHRRDDSPGSSSSSSRSSSGHRKRDNRRSPCRVPTGSRLIRLTREMDVIRSKVIRHPMEGMDESRTRMRGKHLTRRTSLQPRMVVSPRWLVHQLIPNMLSRVM